MHYTALVTLLIAILYVYLGLQVAAAHRQFGVALPKTYGNEDFERVYRAHMNAVEWAPVFLPPLWLFAYYVSDIGAALIGLVWIGARVWYLALYRVGVDKRFPAFAVQGTATLVLLAGDLIAILVRIVKG
jgi:glutathione S-transferase